MASPAQLKVLLDLSDGAEFNETTEDCYDISDIVMTAHTRRGRSKELDKIESGYAVITVVDENGDFNPDNSDSPYFGKLKPSNKIRLYPLYNDGSGDFRYPDIFTGYITNYLNRFSMGVNSANEIVIEANDAFKVFNSYSITDVVNSTSGDSSDERINAILDEISWPSSLRLFETSALSLAADQGDLRTVLDAIRQVEDTEVGLFYIDGSGVAQFKNRTTVNVTPNTADAYVFSDTGSDTTYNGISFSQNDNILINRVTVRSYDGTNEVTVYNSSSETSYFSRSGERNNVLVTSTNDLTEIAQQLLFNLEDPSIDIESIVLNITDYEAFDRVIAALYLDIFFVPIAVYKTMPNNTSIQRIGWVQGVNHDITPSGWVVTAFTGLTSFTGNWLTNFVGAGFRGPSNRLLYVPSLAILDGSNIIAWFGPFVKVNAYGDVILQQGYSPSGGFNNANQDSYVAGITSDNNNNFYIVNADKPVSYQGLKIYKINRNLEIAWGIKLSLDNSYNDDFAERVTQVCDLDGNLYVFYSDTEKIYFVPVTNDGICSTTANEYYIYSSEDTVTVIDSVFHDNHIYAIVWIHPYDASTSTYELLKLDTTGAIVDQIGLDLNVTEFWPLRSMTIDNNGNIYMVYVALSSGGKYNIGILKLNSDYDIVWNKYYKNNDTADDASPQRIQIDSNGNLILLVGRGKYETIIKFDNQGEILDQVKLSTNSVNDNGIIAKSLILDSENSMIMTAGITDTSLSLINPTYNAIVIKLKPTFNVKGTYAYFGSTEFVYSTGDYYFGTDGATTITGTSLELMSTTYMYSTTDGYITTTNAAASEIFTLEFDS